MQIKTNEIKFSSIKFDGHKLMRQAHNQARIWHINSGKTYREDFRMALKAAWECAKGAVVGCICEIGRIAQRTLKGMVKMVKAEAKNTKEQVINRLLDLGCKVWTKGSSIKRIYLNHNAQYVFSNYDDFGRGRKAKLNSVYFDCTTGTWEDNWIGALRPEFEI